MAISNLSVLRVAVVDDSPHICKLIRLTLAAFGIQQVRTYGDGVEALRTLREDPVDVLLCDWEMRPVDGLTLVQRIRRVETGPFSAIPIIMITAHTSEDRVRAALAAGATYVVAKPLAPQVLYDRLLWAMTHPQGAQAADRKPRGAPATPQGDPRAGRMVAPVR